MSDANNDEELTAWDLRSRLFNKLQSSGVVDNLKTQLRSTIMRSLAFPRASTTAQGTGPLAIAGHVFTCRMFNPVCVFFFLPAPLRQQIANTLIAEYLQSCGYGCSLSIFLPESGLGTDAHARASLSRHDLLAYLRLPHKLTAANAGQHRDTTVAMVSCHSNPSTSGIC